MKKIIALALCTISLLAITSCGKFTCDICSEEKSGKKHTEDIFGTKITYCNDCKKAIEELADLEF